MALNPEIDLTTASALLLEAQTKARDVTKGQLSDFSAASPVTAILEAVVLVGINIQASLNNLANTLESNRVAVFGLERQQGTAAVGTVKVNLDALYGDAFFLPKAFSLVLDGIPFETITDLVIPAYTESGNVAIICSELGSRGNLPITTNVFYQAISKISNISLVSNTNGGVDIESEIDFKNRSYVAIRQRETLVSEDDFVTTLTDYLGAGSTAIAIGRLKQDRVTYANGYISVFGLNPDGTQLNTQQLSDLNSYFNQKVAMAYVIVSSIDLFSISVTIYASFTSGNSPETIASQIRNVCLAYLKPGELTPGEQILNKAIERRIQEVEGIKEGLVSVLLNGLAQPLSLPNKWTVGNTKQITINLTSTDTNNNQLFTFTYQF